MPPSRPTCLALAAAAATFALTMTKAAAIDGNEAVVFDWSEVDEEICPEIMPKVFANAVPRGKMDVSYTKVQTVEPTYSSCYRSCCERQECQVAFMFVNSSAVTCYHVSCDHDDTKCLPVDPGANAKTHNRSSMVLVRTANGKDTWQTLLDDFSKEQEEKGKEEKDEVQGNTKKDESEASSRSCSVDDECGVNERCISKTCVCPGVKHEPDGGCVAPSAAPLAAPTTPPAPKKLTVQVISKEVQLPENSATLSAYAVTPNKEKVSGELSYEWRLMAFTPTGPGSSAGGGGDVGGVESGADTGIQHGNMKNSHSSQLELSGLEQGVYQFKVTVDGKDPPMHGEAIANVTVLPPKHINSPPHALLKPETQTINLPTSKAILDASESTDDAPKENLVFDWEVLDKPIGYEQTPAKLPATSTLTLEKLVSGSYTVRVKVTDAEGASDEATASIVVEEEKDYPPTANAGEDIIIYLPTTEARLHGNQSTDDHGIETWEWTRKSPPEGGRDLAADSTNMRTAHPVLTNLEEGTYTFILKVTDAKGQSSTDEVNVYVKPAINLPPTANAGKDISISLPRTWIALDGSGSNDDIEITLSEWQLMEGPNQPSIEKPNELKTNVTGLTKGKYVFQLTVKDNLGNRDASNVTVTVAQDQNMAPRANAGEDFSMVLPTSYVVLDGFQSWDDLKIARWEWTRDSSSLAAGKIVGSTDKEAKMMLINLVPGQYSFKLQVWDDQGKTSSDQVNFVVKEDPDKLNVIRAVLNQNVSSMSAARLDEVMRGLELLLHSRGAYKIRVRQVRAQDDTDNAEVDFVVATSDPSLTAQPEQQQQLQRQKQKRELESLVGIEVDDDVTTDEEVVASGKKVVQELDLKLRQDPDLLSLRILTLDTVVCQNDCSGHGRCHQATRSCICEPFWLENFVRRHLMDGRSNCEWSVIYVGILLATLAACAICGLCYASTRRDRRGGSRRSRTRLSSNGSGAKYTRLGQHEESIELRSPPTTSRRRPQQTSNSIGVVGPKGSLMLSESDDDLSEEEILFDNGPIRANGAPGGARRRPENA